MEGQGTPIETSISHVEQEVADLRAVIRSNQDDLQEIKASSNSLTPALKSLTGVISSMAEDFNEVRALNISIQQYSSNFLAVTASLEASIKTLTSSGVQIQSHPIPVHVMTVAQENILDSLDQESIHSFTSKSTFYLVEFLLYVYGSQCRSANLAFSTCHFRQGKYYLI